MSAKRKKLEAAYRFFSTWVIAASVEQVYDVLEDSLKWPEWWTGVEAVEELEPGDDTGKGSLRRYAWKSRLPYRITFDMRTTEVAGPHLLRGVAEGDLLGSGCWRLFDSDLGTAVTYEWTVQTTELWMNLLAPIARPVFSWNHDYVMRNGAVGLAERVGSQLIASN